MTITGEKEPSDVVYYYQVSVYQLRVATYFVVFVLFFVAVVKGLKRERKNRKRRKKEKK